MDFCILPIEYKAVVLLSCVEGTGMAGFGHSAGNGVAFILN